MLIIKNKFYKNFQLMKKRKVGNILCDVHCISSIMTL